MHSMTKVVILLLLINGIEYSMSKAEDKCDLTNGGKVTKAALCGQLKFTSIQMPKQSFGADGGGDPKTCCTLYAGFCYETKAVSNTCVCETITTDIPLTHRYESTAVLTTSGKRNAKTSMKRERKTVPMSVKMFAVNTSKPWIRCSDAGITLIPIAMTSRGVRSLRCQ